MRRTWKEIDQDRETLKSQSPRFSRAEMCRRAGISESTVVKGIQRLYVPTRAISKQVELVLEAERQAIEGGLR